MLESHFPYLNSTQAVKAPASVPQTATRPAGRVDNPVSRTVVTTGSEGTQAVSSQKDEEGSFGFGDFLDLINPLQHIPVVNHFYRNITGDEIRDSGKLIGGALFGGPIGAGSAFVNMLVERNTGQNLTEHVLDVVFQDSQEAPKQTRSDYTEEQLSQALLSYRKNAFSENTSTEVHRYL